MFVKRIHILIVCLCAMVFQSTAQETYPVNGTYDKSQDHYVFTNATIHISADQEVSGALEIKNGKVVAVGPLVIPPKGAVQVDLKGAHIYPAFIDLLSDYGQKDDSNKKKWDPRPQLESSKDGAFSWNEAVHPEVDASQFFSVDEKQAKEWRKYGYGALVSHIRDGIARGTGALVTTANEPETQVMLRDNVSSHFSFDKGSSKQSYPSSTMGSIALLRQTWHDALWYEQFEDPEEKNLSLESLLDQRTLPQIFEVNSYLDALRADKIGDEFDIQYVIRARGDEYKRVDEVKASGATYIVPVHFPKAIDVRDPYDAMNTSLEELKEWELAPSNLAMLHKAGVPFAITMDGLKEKNTFFKNLRKAIKRGVPKSAILAGMTQVPAEIIDAQDLLGSLSKGKIASFVITSDDILETDASIYETWVRGVPYVHEDRTLADIRGKYDVNVGSVIYELEVSGKREKPKASIKPQGADSTKFKVNLDREKRMINISFNPKDTMAPGVVRLSGNINFDSGTWDGKGQLGNGKWIVWSAIRNERHKEKEKEAKKDSVITGEPWLPIMAYGLDSFPPINSYLIKNATVWTNEEQGILENADVLIQDGKIAYVGQILDVVDPGTVKIDGTGMHVTCGIIDEHSHIAVSGGVNEGGQAVSAEVEIGSVVNPDDINIYRQLAGGVTCSQLLHGSANPIGGQSALVKLRWGASADSMLVNNAPGFIKFALGENVKQSNWGQFNTIRFPQTRMGVEQVFYDAFIRAREYKKEWEAYESLRKRQQEKTTAPRRDLELETLVEILDEERFITCHSYVQSEITMLMRVADSMGFTLNTFTHILEGYKVADKMKAHGAGGSTFSDWWAYKYEVKDAIPYNGAILHEQGIVTAFNSDDAEMARRLNQEAAKAVKYGGVSEEDAWKFVTLNPAKLLHVDDRMGSLKPGKDADVVVWSENPLSIYAKANKTFVDGVLLYDREKAKEKQKRNDDERTRIINKMIEAIDNGEPIRKSSKAKPSYYKCRTNVVRQ